MYMAIIKFPLGTRSRHDQFEKLVQPYLHKLYRLAYYLTGQQAEAEDMVQDVVVKLYPRLQEMQKIEQPGPWLARVMYHHFIDHRRSSKRSPVYLLDDGSELEEYLEDTPGPAENTETSILQNHLRHALDGLNEDQRALMILHDVEGYTLNEVHNILGVPIGTLKSRLNRARGRLREILHDMEPFHAGKRVNK
jgi:RNA polymerase sigma-70 factor (ECF subfamily)